MQKVGEKIEFNLHSINIEWWNWKNIKLKRWLKKKSKAISGEPSKIGLIFKTCNPWNPRHVFNQEAQTKIN